MNISSPYDFYHLRIPVFPVENILWLNSLLHKFGESGNDAELKETFSHPWFQEAIYLSSKDLHAILSDWLSGKLTEKKKVDKLISSLHKYYTRMSTRPTPYGMFAGCTTGVLSAGNSDIRFDPKKIRRSSRPDMSYIIELLDGLNKDERLRSQLNYYPNNSIYKVQNKYRYFESQKGGQRRPYTLTAINVSEYTSLLLHSARNGSTIEQMSDAIILQSEGKLSGDKILTFINGLIDMQFLVSELNPIITGTDFFDRLLQRLKTLRGAEHIYITLEEIRNCLQQEDYGPDICMAVDKKAQELVATWKHEIIQTDVCFNMTSNKINEKIINDIRGTTARLLQISRLFRIDAMAEFKIKFSERYENREIPLLQVLDTDTGIGYGLAVNGNVEQMPLLNNLSLPHSVRDPEFIYDKFSRLVYEKAKQHLKTGSQEVTISDEELDAFLKDHPTGEPEASGSFLMGNLLAASLEDLDKGNYKFFARHINSPFTAKILARFSYADKALLACLMDCIKKEQEEYPDAIFAEIVHFPEDARLANIIIRPELRPFEIPYLCKPSVKQEHVIGVDDLLIRIKNGKITLRSKRLDKEVIPRLTNSHNYAGGLPLYKFLCDLQFDGIKQGFTWDWKFLSKEPFLPRITFRNVIISRARWYLNKISSDEAEQDNYLAQLRTTLNLPRYVTIAEDDNELLIDFDSPFCLKHLLAELKKKRVILLEFLLMPENCPLKDENGGYAMEIVIPAGREKPPALAPAIQKGTTNLTYNNKRTFLPGSEWLYIKLYASNKTLETILTDTIHPFTESLLKRKIIEKWFFVRYNDPESHLRVRFFNGSADKGWLATILNELHVLLAPFQEVGLIHKETLDTYERELERYGDETISLCEDFFFADSMAIAGFLAMIEGQQGEDIRWKMAFYSLHLLLNDFGFTIQEKCSFTDKVYSSYFREFNNGLGESQSMLSKSLNDKYRNASAAVDQMLGMPFEDDELTPALDFFRNRSIINRKIISGLKAAVSDRPDPVKAVHDLISSLAHMSINRFFLTRQRVHELILYHHLHKYYSSLNIRLNQATARDKKSVLTSQNS